MRNDIETVKLVVNVTVLRPAPDKTNKTDQTL